MRLLAVLLLSLCSACNALTGASELEPVECTVACGDASVATDAKTYLDTGLLDTTSAPPDTAPAVDATGMCSNGVRDTIESDVDCGGPCPKCAANRGCTANADCASDLCVDGKCARCGPKMVNVTGPGVTKSSYCIDTHEVTNVEYKAFLDSGPKVDSQPTICSWNTTFQPSTWPYIETRATFPVRWVDWCDALAYCTFRGKRLCGKIGGGDVPFGATGFADPAVDEWFNACSVGGSRIYPYGNTVDYDYCNSRNSGYGSAIHVGTLMACTNTYGTFDMSGNVAEWESSCSGLEGASDTCRVRGGSFNTLDPRCAVSEGFARQTANELVGIRCCDD